MRAADTNIVLRVLTRDDVVQTEAALEAIKHGAWISHLVLAEVVWVLRTIYQCPQPALIKAIGYLLESEDFVLEDADTVAKALKNYSVSPKLGFSDCLIHAIAEKAGHTPLLTFDKALSKLTNTLKVNSILPTQH